MTRTNNADVKTARFTINRILREIHYENKERRNGLDALILTNIMNRDVFDEDPSLDPIWAKLPIPKGLSSQQERTEFFNKIQAMSDHDEAGSCNIIMNHIIKLDSLEDQNIQEAWDEITVQEILER